MLLNILAVGDVVGEGGQDILSRRLRDLKDEHDVHFTVVNGENCSGVGILPRQAQRLFDAGADVITLGNHTWNRIQIAQYMEKEPALLRPHNYAGKVPGCGFRIFKCQGVRIAVLNLMGRIELNPNLEASIRRSGVTRFSVYLNRMIGSVEVNGRHVLLRK